MRYGRGVGATGDAYAELDGNPTISQLSDAGWLAINTIVEEKTVRQLIPRLKAARAEGIVEYPLNKVVY